MLQSVAQRSERSKFALPTPKELQEILVYFPTKGTLFLRERKVSFWEDTVESAEKKAKRWNKNNAGKQAFRTINQGQFVGTILRRNLKASRVCWAVHTGEWPKYMIDHVNGNRFDNRIDNLRDVPQKICQSNPSKGRIANVLPDGVRWVNAEKKWMSFIYIGSKQIPLGLWGTKGDAMMARKMAELKFGVHQ